MGLGLAVGGCTTADDEAAESDGAADGAPFDAGAGTGGVYGKGRNGGTGSFGGLYGSPFVGKGGKGGTSGQGGLYGAPFDGGDK